MLKIQHGAAERALVQTQMLLGFASVARAYQYRQLKTNSTNGHTNGVREAPTGLMQSSNQLHATLAHPIPA